MDMIQTSNIILDGQKCLLDCKYGKPFTKTKIVLLIFLSNYYTDYKEI